MDAWFWRQTVAVLAVFAYSLVVTFTIAKVLDKTMGLRVDTQEELQGLDLTQHGEEGYIFL